MNKYEVQVTGQFVTWVEVEAEDETDAESAAVQEVKDLGHMNDWTDDGMYVAESVTPVTA